MAGVDSAIAIAPGTKSFALSSFYYGCATASQQGVISLATACNITVTAYGSTAIGAKPVASQVFDFKPVSVRIFLLAIAVIILTCNLAPREVSGLEPHADRENADT